MPSSGYPLIYITEPNLGKAVLNIAPGDHTVKQYDLTPMQILALTIHLLAISRQVMSEAGIVRD